MPNYLIADLKQEYNTLLNPQEFEAEDYLDNLELLEFERIEQEELKTKL